MGNFCCCEKDEDEYSQMNDANIGYQPPNLMNTFETTPQMINNFSLIEPKELTSDQFQTYWKEFYHFDLKKLKLVKEIKRTEFVKHLYACKFIPFAVSSEEEKNLKMYLFCQNTEENIFLLEVFVDFEEKNLTCKLKANVPTDQLSNYFENCIKEWINS